MMYHVGQLGYLVASALFILAFTKDKVFQLDLSDDIQQGALITHEGNVAHARTREALDKR